MNRVSPDPVVSVMFDGSVSPVLVGWSLFVVVAPVSFMLRIHRTGF